MGTKSYWKKEITTDGDLNEKNNEEIQKWVRWIQQALCIDSLPFNSFLIGW